MLRSIKKDAVIGVQALQTDSFLVEGVNDFAGYLNSFQIDVQTTSSNGQLRHYLDERLGKRKKFPVTKQSPSSPIHFIDHPPLSLIVRALDEFNFALVIRPNWNEREILFDDFLQRL